MTETRRPTVRRITFFRDFTGVANATSFTLTLSELAAGEYEYTSWSYDPGSTSFSRPGSYVRPVTLTDALATGASVGNATKFGVDTTPLDSPTDPDPFNAVVPFTTQFTSNGTDPIVIVYGAGDGNFVINGFEIAVVPEPSTAALLSGAFMIAGRRRRPLRSR